MTMISRLICATSLAVALSGCIATTLSQLNTSYNHALARQQEVHKSNDALMKDDIRAEFYAVAQDAVDLVKGADNQATRINILRLGMAAAWQAEERGKTLYATMQAAGQNECSTSQDKDLGHPSDCAIIAYTPLLRGYETLFYRLDPAINSLSLGDDARIERIDQAVVDLASLQQTAITTLPSIYRGEKPYKGASPDLVEYLVEKTYRFSCLTRIASNKAGGIVGRLDRNKNLQDKAATVRDRASEIAISYQSVFDAIGVVPKNRPWAAAIPCK